MDDATASLIALQTVKRTAELLLQKNTPRTRNR
jgi:hypothetical protein